MKKISLITLCLIFSLFFGLASFLACLFFIDDFVLIIKLSVFAGAGTALLLHLFFTLTIAADRKKYSLIEKSFSKKPNYKVSGIFVFKTVCSGSVYVFEDEICLASLDCKPELLVKIPVKDILGCRSNGSAVTIFADKGNILFRTPEADRLMREIHRIRSFFFNV